MFVLKKIRGYFNHKNLNYQLRTALNYKYEIDWDKVRILLEQGANPNSKIIGSESPILIYAIRHSQTDIVKLMVKRGVDRSLKDEVTGLDSVQYAAYLCQYDILGILLEGNAPSQDICDIRGMMYLRYEDRRNASLCFFGTEDASVEDLFERWVEVKNKLWNSQSVCDENQEDSFGLPEFFTMLRFLLCDEEPSERLAEIIRPLPWKNVSFLPRFWLLILLDIDSFGTSKLIALSKFLVKDCGCDMNAKNKHGQTFFHVLFDRLLNNRYLYPGEASYSTWRQCIKDAAIFYLESGFHSCVSDSRGTSVRSLLEKEFPELFPDRQIPRLECLAARIVVKTKIPYTEKVSFRLRKFIPLH